jgi:hypothetical protein
MGLREIKAALRRLENEGGDKAVAKLILAVPFKRGQSGYERSEIVGFIAKGRGESKAEVSKMVTGWQPGILIKAADYDYRPGEGDLALVTEGQFEHAGEIVYFRPDELKWNEAQIIDDGAELFPLDRWEEAVSGILYGSKGSGRGMYFEPYDSRRGRY